MAINPLPLQRPTSADDLATAIAAASANAQIQLTGSNSLPLTAFDLTRPIQNISTLRMNKILDHFIPDMTVRIDAGISLEALQRQLAWHNQWLPVDPPAIGRPPGSRTLGGLIASNSLGPLRFGLSGGDWRRLILGMRWIDASGTLIKGGGQTVKNVAGYSSPRMLVGSCGSLGAIAEVTLRTFARPADERSVLFYCSSAPRAEELLAAILLAPTSPAYLQIIGSQTFSANPLKLPALSNNDTSGMIVAVGYLGRPETCVAQVDAIRSIPAANNLESISQTAAQSGRLRLWMTQELAITTGIGFRLHTKSSQLTSLIQSIEGHASKSGGPTWLVAEAQGILRGCLQTTDASAFMTSLAAEAHSHLLITQGVSARSAPNPLAARLKRALDPFSRFGNAPT